MATRSFRSSGLETQLIHCHAHDYPRLIRRWQKVARASGMKMRAYYEEGGYELFYLESDRKPDPGSSIYLSAGIHGDEPAATEALLSWAEENPVVLRNVRPLIFPCLNPWGLVNNSRFDRDGRDLNRCYHNEEVPQIAAQIRVLGNSRFDLAFLLHEDYDARGYYIYEIAGRRPHLAENLMRVASLHLPADMRTRIEGRRARGGVIRRRVTQDTMPFWPEAFILHFRHAERTFTVEAPSEFHIDVRVFAHVAVLDLAVKTCLEEAKSKQPRLR